MEKVKDPGRIVWESARLPPMQKSKRHSMAANVRWAKYRAQLPVPEEIPAVLGEIVLKGWIFGQEIRLELKKGKRCDSYRVFQNGQEVAATSATDIGRMIGKLLPGLGFW